MSIDGKSIFLLGATGFIGRQTALIALSQGWRVMGVVRHPENAADLAKAGARLLDMRLHYAASDVYQLFDALGPAGRATYRRFYETWDLAMPALFGAFLRMAIARSALRKLRGWAIWRPPWTIWKTSASSFCCRFIRYAWLRWPGWRLG